jgi:Uncharacterized protein conserved in bacteria
MDKKIAIFLIALLFTVSAYCILEVVNADVVLAPKASMRWARSGLGVATVDGKIYAVGGATANGFCSYNEQYDLPTDSWTTKAAMPTARSAFGIDEVNGTIYCIGGYCLNGKTGGATAVNEAYDTLSDSWTTKAPMPIPQINAMANAVNGKIYVIGGSTNGTLNQVYDPATNSWSLKAPVPSGVSAYASAVVSEKIYVFISGLTQIYDTRTDSWTTGAPASASIVTASAAATTGDYAPPRVYVFGADAKLPYWQLTTERFIVQAYDPEADNWTQPTAVSDGRYSAGAVAVDDLLYIIGGFTSQSKGGLDLNPIDTFSTQNDQYTPLDYGTVVHQSSAEPKDAVATTTNMPTTTELTILCALIAILAVGAFVISRKRKGQL